MTYDAIATAIRAKFKTDVATPNGMIVTNDNEPPKGLKQTWYRLTVLPEVTEQMHTGTTGSRRYRITGRAVLNMFRAVGTGDGDMLDVVDLVVAAFNGATIADPIVNFEPPPTLVGGVDQADGWFQRTMDIPFEADVFR